MNEFFEEYGSLIVISSVGYAVMSALWYILLEISTA